MKQFLFRIMGTYPELFNPIWEYLIYPLKKNKLVDKGPIVENSDVFADIFKKSSWGSDESVSGHGSELKYTKILRSRLPDLLHNLGIKSILDAPCGDGNWIRQVGFRAPIKYLGCDIVPELIEMNREKGAFPSKFVSSDYSVMDIVKDDLPDVDLWLCRDVLFHLPTEDALAVLENFRKSKINFLLTTTFSFPKSNIDVRSGGFYPINLDIEPFNLPAPMLKIPDFIVPFPPRYLALYHRDQI
jgi:SAM-dependent methyltransferase